MGAPPIPSPRSSRPPLIASSVAVNLAIRRGECSTKLEPAVPTGNGWSSPPSPPGQSTHQTTRSSPRMAGRDGRRRTTNPRPPHQSTQPSARGRPSAAPAGGKRQTTASRNPIRGRPHPAGRGSRDGCCARISTSGWISPGGAGVTPSSTATAVREE
jgi:hypothetical protein